MLGLRVPAEPLHKGRHELLEAGSEGVILSEVRDDRANAVDNKEVHPDWQRHGRHVQLGQLRHELHQELLPTVAYVLERDGRGLLHLLHALDDMGGAIRGRHRQQQGRYHLERGLEEVRAQLHPLPEAAEQLDRGLLREVQYRALRLVLLDGLRDQRRQALDELPEDAVVPDLRLRPDRRQAEEVRLLDDDTLPLPIHQALEHMLQGTVGGEDLQAILRQVQEPVPVGDEVVVRLEGVLVGAQLAPPYHHAEELHVDGLELVDLGVRLRVPAHLLRQPVPELQGDQADLLRWQVRALEDHAQDAEHLVVPALLHDQVHQALADLDVDSADLQQAVQVGVDGSLDTPAEQRVELCPQAAQKRQDHLDDRLEIVQVHAAHPEDLDDDVGRGLAELAPAGDVPEALGDQRVLGDVCRGQVRELDPAEEALQHLPLGLHGGALECQEELHDLRRRLLEPLPGGRALGGVRHELVVHVLLGEHAEHLQERRVGLRVLSERLEERGHGVWPSGVHLDREVREHDREHGVDRLVLRRPKSVYVLEEGVTEAPITVSRQLVEVELHLRPQRLGREEAEVRRDLCGAEDLVGDLPRRGCLLELYEPVIRLLFQSWIR
mmetsp:Transcript_55633/g.156625  ORF Transcript_55633/g.156625 Transcript_55633/m.156625 type:complete len:608 (-) Transcript_55633:86-1909(-)